MVGPKRREAGESIEKIALDAFMQAERQGSEPPEVRQLGALDASYTGAVSEMLVRGVPGMNEASTYAVGLCLNELLQNVFEWAVSPIGCIALARWYHRALGEGGRRRSRGWHTYATATEALHRR